jgi:hypothetical protein
MSTGVNASGDMLSVGPKRSGGVSLLSALINVAPFETISSGVSTQNRRRINSKYPKSWHNAIGIYNVLAVLSGGGCCGRGNLLE